jgi:hypothetical protein
VRAPPRLGLRERPAQHRADLRRVPPQQLLEQELVEVVPADPQGAADPGLRLPGHRGQHHRRVEGAAAEVVHQHDILVADEVQGAGMGDRGDRLVDQVERALRKARRDRRAGDEAPPAGGPVDRHRHHGHRRLAGALLHRAPAQEPEHRGYEVDDVERAVAEHDRRRVGLDVELEIVAVRLGPALLRVDRRTADEQVSAGLVEADRGGHGVLRAGRQVRVGDQTDRRATADDGQRGRRHPEVDPEHHRAGLGRRHWHTLHVRSWRTGQPARRSRTSTTSVSSRLSRS